MSPIGFLASYAYSATMDMRKFKAQIGNVPLFADSGAFTVHSRGMSLSVESYAKWLWKWHDTLDVYVNLDVVHNAQLTQANQSKLEEYGLKPVHVYHYGTPLSELQRMIDGGATYVALGGTVMKKDTAAQLDWFDKCFDMAQGKVGFHGFGFTRWEYMQQWPWRSVDSSSWLAGARYNTVALFDKGEIVRIDLGVASQRREYLPLIMEHGGDGERFATGKFHYINVFDLGAVAAYRMAVHWSNAAKRHNWELPTLYLAGSNIPCVHAAKAIKRYRRANESVL